MSWRPIDLAPRDGARIVVAFRSPMTGLVSAFVSRWGDNAWERETTHGDYETTGEVAFAWIELPAENA